MAVIGELNPDRQAVAGNRKSCVAAVCNRKVQRDDCDSIMHGVHVSAAYGIISAIPAPDLLDVLGRNREGCLSSTS